MLHPELTEDPMTEESWLIELLQKSGDGDFLFIPDSPDGFAVS
jgi:hypothetical protein